MSTPRRKPPRDAANAPAQENRANRKPPGGKRRSLADVDQLTREIGNLMVLGVNKAGILAALAKGEPATKDKPAVPGIEMPPRTLDDYMARVRASWDEEAKSEAPTRKARQMRRLNGHLRTMLARGRFNDVVNLERLIAQIEGNLAPMKVETGPPKRGWDDLTDEELEQFRLTGKLPEGVTAEDLDKLN